MALVRGAALIGGRAPDLFVCGSRREPHPKAIPSSDGWAIRMTGGGGPTRVRRERSGTWVTGIAMSVGGATVGE
ncbi:hypothetical protein GCM10010394_64440 [Streptomyces crystallinus]|uniref:Uncharacterized protein n=1 Tax=Streptomyces crystallinus TaxID=68191 RepID=A0ABP3S7N8_9ACTN